MPDPTHQTVSASQVPALFNVSTYLTRWMLYQHFAHGYDIEPDENERMEAGKRLEPAVLQWVADELRADVIPHDQSVYFRHPTLPIGCTPDGYVRDPQRGLGFVEVKCVDWLRWKDTWTETEATAAIEAQHQTQLAVPHPEYGLPTWGVIGCLVGGNDLRLYPRAPLSEVQATIGAEATSFLAEVREKREPAVLGTAIEIPALVFAHPYAVRDKIITEEGMTLERAVQLARWIDQYAEIKDRQSQTEKDEKSMKALLLDLVEDAAALNILGRWLDVRKTPIAGSTIERKPYIQVKLTPKLLPGFADLDKLLAEKEKPDVALKAG
jgi:hypothetical protein